MVPGSGAGRTADMQEGLGGSQKGEWAGQIPVGRLSLRDEVLAGEEKERSPGDYDRKQGLCL